MVEMDSSLTYFPAKLDIHDISYSMYFQQKFKQNEWFPVLRHDGQLVRGSQNLMKVHSPIEPESKTTIQMGLVIKL
jgi:hypothetical protein